MLVAVGDDAKVLGVIVYGPAAGYLDRVIIHSLGVDLDFRRQKIGTELKTTVLEECENTATCSIVISGVHRANIEVIGLNKNLNVSFTDDPTDGSYLVAAIMVEP